MSLVPPFKHRWIPLRRYTYVLNVMSLISEQLMNTPKHCSSFHIHLDSNHLLLILSYQVSNLFDNIMSIMIHTSFVYDYLYQVSQPRGSPQHSILTRSTLSNGIYPSMYRLWNDPRSVRYSVPSNPWAFPVPSLLLYFCQLTRTILDCTWLTSLLARSICLCFVCISFSPQLALKRSLRLTVFQMTVYFRAWRFWHSSRSPDWLGERLILDCGSDSLQLSTNFRLGLLRLSFPVVRCFLTLFILLLLHQDVIYILALGALPHTSCPI
jgi:hypothetical protein